MSVLVEKSAKKRRREQYQTKPCLDVYWLESTGREDPIQAREESLTYREEPVDGSQVYSLNTRPWTLAEAEAMQEAAKQLAKEEIPRGKWHQLLAGLKYGEPQSGFHYRRWLQHLTKNQRSCITEKVAPGLSAVRLWSSKSAPWVERFVDGTRRMVCPLLELHQLREMSAFPKTSTDRGPEPA
jgi:hypothetical protein